MLKELSIHNFRSYLETTVNFHRRHLLIGANNSGKTNLCLALRFLADSARTDLSTAAAVPGGVGALSNWGLKDDQIQLSCTCVLSTEQGDVKYIYALTVQPSVTPPTPGGTQLDVAEEKLSAEGGGFPQETVLLHVTPPRKPRQLVVSSASADRHTPRVILVRGRGRLLDEQGNVSSGSPSDQYSDVDLPENGTLLSAIYDRHRNKHALVFKSYLKHWCYFALSPERIRHGWREEPAHDAFTLSRNGNNLAWMIYELKNAEETRYRRVIQRVNRLAPEVAAINFDVRSDQRPVPYIELGSGRKTSWDNLSDGTLRYLALAYLIEWADWVSTAPSANAPLIIIEEPENGLYVQELGNLLEGIEDAAPKGQFLFTSHAPYFIDNFDVDLDAVTLLKREGIRTRAVSLGPRKAQVAKALAEMSLGEQFFRDLLE